MRWRAPVAFDADSTAALVAEALDGLGYGYARGAGARPFEEHVLALAIPRVAPTHRFEVASPVAFVVEAYDTRPTPGGLLPYLELHAHTGEAEPAARALLAEVARRAPRPPWRFTWRQRLALGLLLPEFGASRRAWAQALGEAR